MSKASTSKDNTKESKIVVEPTTAAQTQGPEYSPAEIARQQQQRADVQASLDAQELARQQMAAETKLREEREKKAANK